MSEHQEAQVAPDKVFELPKSLKVCSRNLLSKITYWRHIFTVQKKIDVKMFSMIVDFTLPSYIDPENHDNDRGPAAAIIVSTVYDNFRI